MIISNSKNFIFIHIDKCGGNSVKDALQPYLNKNDILIGSLDFNETEQDLYYLEKYKLRRHSTAKEIKKIVKNNWETMYKFTTVRNPLDIMISLYFYVEKNFKEDVDDEYFTIYKQSLENKKPIDFFIKYLIENKYSCTVPMTSRIDESVEIFDIDNIEENWNYILKKINIVDNVKINKLNKSNRPSNVYLEKETKDLIYDCFIADYQTIPKITKYKWN